MNRNPIPQARVTLYSKADFAVDVDNIDAVLKNKDISNVSITLRKVAK